MPREENEGVQEFSHFEITVHRNPKWLEPYEKRGFFLSTDFPVGTYELGQFKDHTEENIEEIWEYFEGVMSYHKFNKMNPDDCDNGTSFMVPYTMAMELVSGISERNKECERKYKGQEYMYKKLQERVRQGALFEQQLPVGASGNLICPDCKDEWEPSEEIEVLVMDDIQEAICPDCHKLFTFEECLWLGDDEE